MRDRNRIFTYLVLIWEFSLRPCGDGSDHLSDAYKKGKGSLNSLRRLLMANAQGKSFDHHIWRIWTRAAENFPGLSEPVFLLQDLWFWWPSGNSCSFCLLGHACWSMPPPLPYLSNFYWSCTPRVSCSVNYWLHIFCNQACPFATFELLCKLTTHLTPFWVKFLKSALKFWFLLQGGRPPQCPEDWGMGRIISSDSHPARLNGSMLALLMLWDSGAAGDWTWFFAHTSMHPQWWAISLFFIKCF